MTRVLRLGPASAVLIVVLVAMLGFMTVGAGRASADESSFGGEWVEAACESPFSEVDGPCFEFVGAVEDGVMIDNAQWKEMTDTYVDQAYRAVGETPPSELVGDAAAHGEELSQAYGSLSAETSIGEVEGDVLAEGGIDLSGWVGTAGAFADVAAPYVLTAGIGLYTGFKIGEAIAGVFGLGEVSEGEPAVSEWVAVKAVPTNKTVLSYEEFHGGQCAGSFEFDTYLCTPVDVGRPGYVLTFKRQGVGSETAMPYAYESSSSSSEPPDPEFHAIDVPSGFQKYLVSETYQHNYNEPSGGLSTHRWYVYWRPATISSTSTSAAGALKESSATTPKNLTVAREGAERALKSPGYSAFNRWAFNHGARPQGLSESVRLASPFYDWPSVCRVGAQRSVCVEALRELEVVPDVEELDWEHAVLPPFPVTEPETGREEGANVIEELPSPLPSVVSPGEELSIVVNPSYEDMPEVVPGARSGEKYSEYQARLNPSFQANEHLLGEVAESPSAGPEGVASVEPAPGTRVDPQTETQLSVDVNPDTAPQSGTYPPSTSGFTPPAVPSIVSPFSGISPCGVFPFGLFCWIGGAIGEFEVSPKCPSAGVPLRVPDGHGGETNDSFELGFCQLPELEHWIGLWRSLVLFFFTIGCGWTFAKATGAVGGGGDGD